MSISAKKILGYAWASPLTILGASYALLFQAVGWYAWHGRIDDGLVWRVTPGSPAWLQKLWKKWGGHTIGNIIVLNCDPLKKSTTVDHEMAHVRQCMRLGIFQPIVYAISSLGIYLGCESSDPYWSNPFEIDARRTAGQTVDVEGTLKKLREKQ